MTENILVMRQATSEQGNKYQDKESLNKIGKF
jgi:hypothetical protein